MALKTMGTRVQATDLRAVKPPPKEADAELLTPEHRAWRDKIIANAGGRCEAVDNGQRCRKAQPQHRLFADHIKERRDGGDPLDPANGQCLCGSHHTAKTIAERAKRAAR